VFLDLLQEKWDLFCHYGAVVDNYRSWDFDPIAATRQNTANVRAVLARLAMNGCRAIVFTGSVFEPYEGRGDPECQASRRTAYQST
jgi:UDP-glucose 4-epimerase